MKTLLAASVILAALAAPAAAQQTTQGDPNREDQPSERGLGSDDIVRQDGGVDGGTTGAIILQEGVDSGASDGVAPNASTGTPRDDGLREQGAATRGSSAY